jgi:hypothetical protein
MCRLSRSLIYTIIAAVLLLPRPAAGVLDEELRLQNDALAWTTAGEWDDFRTAGGSLLLREGTLTFRLGTIPSPVVPPTAQSRACAVMSCSSPAADDTASTLPGRMRGSSSLRG